MINKNGFFYFVIIEVMMLALIFPYTLHWIIRKQMPYLLTPKNKFKFNYCNNLEKLTTNNKEFYVITTKNKLSNNVITKVLKINELFSPVTTI